MAKNCYYDKLALFWGLDDGDEGGSGRAVAEAVAMLKQQNPRAPDELSNGLLDRMANARRLTLNAN